MGRSYDESCVLLDGIVGRCARDAAFAQAVVADPVEALADYQLEEHELDDFRALSASHGDEALEAWAAVRGALPKGWAGSSQECSAPDQA